MKKLILILLAALPFWSCESSNIKPIEFSSLPSKAQSFVKQHFADKTITMVFCDDELFDTLTYDEFVKYVNEYFD